MLMSDMEYRDRFMTEEPWQTVAMRLRHGDRSYVPANLVDWPSPYDDPKLFTEDCGRLLLAMYLVRGEKPPKELPMATYCQDAEAWLEVPLVCALEDGCVRIVPVLLGYAESDTFRPSYEEGLLTPKCIRVLKAAMSVDGQSGRWWVISRLSPDALPAPIDDTSIALPMALAAMNLRSSDVYPPDNYMLFLSGNIEGTGYVYGMSNLADKLRCLAKNGDYDGDYIVPADNLSEVDRPLEGVFGISDILEAICLQRLWAVPHESIPAIARLIPSWQKRPVEFLEWMAQGNGLPVHLFAIISLADMQGWFEELSEDGLMEALPVILAVLARIEGELPALRKEREGLPDGEQRIRFYETLPARFLELFSFEALSALPDSMELMRVACAQLHLPENEAEACAQWKGLAARCLAELVQSPSATQSLADLEDALQSLAIHQQGCRFLVEDVPDAWTEAVDRAIVREDPHLAACAHMLFRHMALCGEYERAAHYADLALRAEPDAERKRQYHLERMNLDLAQGNLAAACEALCAAADRERVHFDFARAIAETGKPKAKLCFAKLCQSLKLDGESIDALDLMLAVTQSDSQFRTNLFIDLCHEIDRDVFATFLAEDLHTAEQPAKICAAFLHLCVHIPLLFPYKYKKYRSVMDNFTYDTESRHPWELWHYFQGKLLLTEDRQKAGLHFKDSADICLKERAQSRHIMALLPLASLYAEKLLPEQKILQTTGQVMDRMRDYCAKGQLFEPRFRTLLGMAPAQVLQEVAAHPKLYFPISWT